MKKGLLIVAFLCFLAGLAAFFFAYNSFNLARLNQESADKFMAQSKATKDMAQMEALGEHIREFAIEASDDRRTAMVAAGGGALLEALGVILFLKSRGPRTTP